MANGLVDNVGVVDDVEVKLQKGTLVYCVNCNRPVYWLKYEGRDRADFPDDFVPSDEYKKEVSPVCPGCNKKAFYNDVSGVATFRTARGFKDGTIKQWD